MVTPSCSLVIAEEFGAWASPDEISLKVGIFGAEPWRGHAQRDRAQAGHRRHRHLRPDRSDGFGVACECIETKDGPVIWEDHFYPEIIGPETGEVLPDGEEGELVFTR